MTDWPSDECRSCKAPIVWAKTRTGKDMPIDAEPRPDGNIRLTVRGGQPYADVLSAARIATSTSWGALRTSHFVTCAQAGQWRTRGPR